MSLPHPRGLIYHCNVCGSELTVLAFAMGAFEPTCCDTPMVPGPRRISFYHCEKCGADIAVLKEGPGDFTPRCCNEPMRTMAA